MIKYKGKYPNRIHSIWTITKKHYEGPLNGFHRKQDRDGLLYKDVYPQFTPAMYVMTNNGAIYRVKNEHPTLGLDIAERAYTDYQFVEWSTKRS